MACLYACAAAVIAVNLMPWAWPGLLAALLIFAVLDLSGGMED